MGGGVCCPCLQEFDLKIRGYRDFGFRARSLVSGLLLSKELKLNHQNKSIQYIMGFPYHGTLKP